MDESRGFLLTRHWRDTQDGTEVDFWVATDAGPRRLQLAMHPSVAFIPAEQREQAQAVILEARISDPETSGRRETIAIRDSCAKRL